MNFHQKPNKFVSRVHLKVQHLERSLAFYQEVIGFKVLNRTAKAADLTADGRTVLLTVEQPDNVIPKQGRTTGLYHFALLLPSRQDLAGIVRHFAALNQRFGSSDHLVSEALYLSDPDGNGIEVYADRDDADWSWNGGQVEMAVDPLDFENLLADGGQTEWQGLPPGTVMGHIHLHVSDLRAAEQFYTQGLGFEVVSRYGAQALFISAGRYHHHIGLNIWNGEGAPKPPNNSAGLSFYTLVLPDKEARERVIAKLQQLGADLEIEEDSVFAADPSGNRILLSIS
ncbi:VOC family protein [Paenibacillus pinihumi]|uniref:VOC family protein n=1 Tax=Paenibacillus pinihumi TaxID=669462 RepID=UPI0003F9D2B9|nr:VOC family protein [Paenibacillus pinihumi]